MRLLLVLAMHAMPALCLNGLATKRVNTNSRAYQKDPAYPPDKESLWKAPEEKDGWMESHNALRKEVAAMKTALTTTLKGRPLADWERGSIKAWWKGHFEIIHQHHLNEDDIFTPFMEKRVKYPRKLTSDHNGLVAQLRKIDDIVSGDLVRADQLRSAWSKYQSMLLPHLREEEMVGLPLSRAYFTPSEVNEQVMKILANEPPVGGGSFIHGLGGKAAMQEFMAQEGIPFFVWYIQFSGQYQVYKDTMLVHMEALLSGTPPPPPPLVSTTTALIVLLASLLVAKYRKWM